MDPETIPDKCLKKVLKDAGVLHTLELVDSWSGTKADRSLYSTIIDKNNTAGFARGKEDVLVAFLTDTGAGEAIAYSRDRGRTFTWYKKNPVVRHRGRDPKVVWYAPGKHWVMAVYDESKEAGRAIAFYTSRNLIF